MQKRSRFHKPQFNHKLKTLIIGASGKIGKYILEKRNKNYVYTYNKKKMTKNNNHKKHKKINLKKRIKNLLTLKFIKTPRS